MRKPLGVPECQRLPGAAERKSWSHSKGQADTTRKQEEEAPDFAARNGSDGGNFGNKVARRDRRAVHLLICHRSASGADWPCFPMVSPGPGLAAGRLLRRLLRRLLHRATCPGREPAGRAGLLDRAEAGGERVAARSMVAPAIWGRAWDRMPGPEFRRVGCPHPPLRRASHHRPPGGDVTLPGCRSG